MIHVRSYFYHLMDVSDWNQSKKKSVAIDCEFCNHYWHTLLVKRKTADFAHPHILSRPPPPLKKKKKSTLNYSLASFATNIFKPILLAIPGALSHFLPLLVFQSQRIIQSPNSILKRPFAGLATERTWSDPKASDWLIEIFYVAGPIERSESVWGWRATGKHQLSRTEINRYIAIVPSLEKFTQLTVFFPPLKLRGWTSQGTLPKRNSLNASTVFSHNTGCGQECRSLLPRDAFCYFAHGHKSLQLMSQCYCSTREQGGCAEPKGVHGLNSALRRDGRLNRKTDISALVSASHSTIFNSFLGLECNQEKSNSTSKKRKHEHLGWAREKKKKKVCRCHFRLFDCSWSPQQVWKHRLV